MAREHQPRNALARPEPLPDSEETELLAEARRTFPPGGPIQLPQRQEAVDATGAVRVTVDARARIVDIEIGQRWRDRLDANGLLDTLLDTYRAAVDQAVDAFALAGLAARETGEDPPVVDDVPAARTDLGRPPDPAVDRDAWWRWLQDLQANIMANRERRAHIEAGASLGPRAHTGPHGYLTATVDKDEVTGLIGDTRRIWHASTAHLRQDALAVLSAAHQPTQS